MVLGTQKAYKAKHSIGISLPYWASLQGVYMEYPYPNFVLCAFWGPYGSRCTVSIWLRGPHFGLCYFENSCGVI